MSAALRFDPLPARWELRRGCTAVFALDLDAHAARCPRDVELLDPAERARATRFRTELLQRRHVAAHGSLRRILGQALGLGPAELRLVEREDGKPCLARPDDRAVWFNLSHSARLALVAVSADGEVGVDVEEIRALPDAEDVAERVFTAGERAAIARAMPAGRPRAFFEAWTRKEAYIKATGEGLRAPLLDIEISPESSSAKHAVLHGRGASTSEVQWSVLDLEPEPGFAAALATPRGTPSVECYRFAAERPCLPADSGSWNTR